jgi:hypothetical protein
MNDSHERRTRPTIVRLALTCGILMLCAMTTAAPTVMGAPSEIFVTPGSIDTSGKVSPPFSEAEYIVRDDYADFGLQFGNAALTAIFNDPPLAWGGVNEDGIVDLLAPVSATVAMPGHGAVRASTTRLSVEAGFADVGTLLLRAYDCNGRIVGRTLNDDGVGPNERTLLSLRGRQLHSFIVSTPTGDTFGVPSIKMARPVPCRVRATLDVKPGSDANPVNVSSQGVIPVAILTTGTFDARHIDPSSVCFGDHDQPARRDCTEAHRRLHVDDANGDGREDAVLHFDTDETGISQQDTKACVTGRLRNGTPFAGCDRITTR